jgi:hypothetical protein
MVPLGVTNEIGAVEELVITTMEVDPDDTGTMLVDRSPLEVLIELDAGYE